MLPTVADFLRARDDRRLAYLSCITAWHLIDHVARVRHVGVGDERSRIGKIIPSAYSIVRGLSTGTKHGERDGVFYPGKERAVPVFAFNGRDAVLGRSRFRHPGLEVEVEPGPQRTFVDWSVQSFIVAECVLNPSLLGSVSLEPLDEPLRKSAATLLNVANQRGFAII